MTEKNVKALMVLLIFFLLDSTKPFAYSLITEFTFLGVVLICFNYPLKTSLFFAVIFGYFKDAISADAASFNLLEFSAVTVAIHYCLRNFHGKAAKILIFCGALATHIIINNLRTSKAAYLFSLLFFIQSSIVFLLISRLFGQWLYGGLKENNVI